MLVAGVLGQNFGGGGLQGTTTTQTGGSTTTSVTSSVGTTTSVVSTSTTTIVASTTTPVIFPTSAPPTASFGKATVGESPSATCETFSSPDATALVSVEFEYQDLFLEAPSLYCCPHRRALLQINASNTPSGAVIPLRTVGIATVADALYTLGISASLDPAIIPAGHVAVLWVSGQNIQNASLPSFSLPFASAIVPLPPARIQLSAFSSLPNAALGLPSSLIGYVLSLRVADNGLAEPANVISQWTSNAGLASSIIFGSFPARTSATP